MTKFIVIIIAYIVSPRKMFLIVILRIFVFKLSPVHVIILYFQTYLEYHGEVVACTSDEHNEPHKLGHHIEVK